MKNIRFMFIIALFGIFALSCEREETIPKGINEDPFLSEARSFFEGHTPIATRSNLQGKRTLLPDGLSVSWENALVKSSSNYRYAYIPLPGENEFVAISTNSIRQGEYYQSIRVWQIIGIIQNVQTGKMDISLISFIPNFDYNKQNKENPAIGFFSQTNRRNFSGLVLFHSYNDMSLKLVNEYNSGEKVFSLSESAVANKREFAEQTGKYLKNLRFFKCPIRIHTRSIHGNDTIPFNEEMPTEEEVYEEAEPWEGEEVSTDYEYENYRVGWISSEENSDDYGIEDVNTSLVRITVYGDDEVAYHIIDLEEAVCTPDSDTDEAWEDWDDWNDYDEWWKAYEDNKVDVDDVEPYDNNDNNDVIRPWNPGNNQGGGGSNNNDNNSNKNNNNGRKTIPGITIPKQLLIQKPNQCVPTCVLYAFILAEQDVRMIDLIRIINKKYKANIRLKGMNIETLNKYTKDYCNTINFISYEHAVDNGYFVVVSQHHKNGGGHALLVVGYEPDGKLITIDPDTGKEKIINKSEVKGYSNPFSPK